MSSNQSAMALLLWRPWILALLWLALGGCSPATEEAATVIEPVHFDAGDECHVCGMMIKGFPGPKGEVLGGDPGAVRKFCSTRDLFTWVLQPENAHRDFTLYVHDMSQTEWDHPADTALIDAREALYVLGSSRKGAMGPTLASFASRDAAEAFAGQYGGTVLAFSDITLARLQSGEPAHDSGHDAMETMSSHGDGHEHHQPE